MQVLSGRGTGRACFCQGPEPHKQHMLAAFGSMVWIGSLVLDSFIHHYNLIYLQQRSQLFQTAQVPVTGQSSLCLCALLTLSSALIAAVSCYSVFCVMPELLSLS